MQKAAGGNKTCGPGMSVSGRARVAVRHLPPLGSFPGSLPIPFLQVPGSLASQSSSHGTSELPHPRRGLIPNIITTTTSSRKQKRKKKSQKKKLRNPGVEPGSSTCICSHTYAPIFGLSKWFGGDFNPRATTRDGGHADRYTNRAFFLFLVEYVTQNSDPYSSCQSPCVLRRYTRWAGEAGCLSVCAGGWQHMTGEWQGHGSGWRPDDMRLEIYMAMDKGIIESRSK